MLQINMRGIALVTVILTLLFLFPLVYFLVWFSSQHLFIAQKDKQLTVASGLANNALVDFMRQFSQNYYEGHYDTRSLSRDEAFYKAGFSTVTYKADPLQHRLYLRAIGKYGKKPDNPLADKTLHAVVQFISDMTDYGTLINGQFTISASNVTYYGKWWITGNLGITGNNVRFIGGPVIVGGTISGGSGCVIEGDLYYGGSSVGNVTVTGSKFNFYPSDMFYPTVNDSFYIANCNYKITTNRELRFNAHASSGTFTIVGTTITIPIIGSGPMAPSGSGMIILGENCNLTLYGTVRGRVTVVTVGTTNGLITIGKSNLIGNLLYYNPLTGGTTTSAIYGNSFAAIARNGITFRGKTTSPTADLTVCGAFFNRSTANMSAIGASGRRFIIFGTRNKPISLSGFTGGTALYYDPYLNASAPPALPERPCLVTWHLR